MTETRKLVKARVKAPEYLPDWTRCCDAPLTKVAEDMDYFTVDLSRKRSAEGKCIFCESPHGVLTQVIGFFPDAQWINIEILDLDEVPEEIQAERKGRYVDAH